MSETLAQEIKRVCEEQKKACEEILGLRQERDRWTESWHRDTERLTKERDALRAQVADFRMLLKRIAEGDHVGTPINKGSAVMVMIEQALSAETPKQPSPKSERSVPYDVAQKLAEALTYSNNILREIRICEDQEGLVAAQISDNNDALSLAREHGLLKEGK